MADPKKEVATTTPSKDPTALVKEALGQYIRDGIICDFSSLPSYAKLQLLQNTPSDMIKQRSIGSTSVPYVPHWYAEKALNFVFNFNVSCDVIKTEKITKTVNGKTIYEAMAMVAFTFYDAKNDREIKRTVVGTHKGYQNPALTEFDSIKSAISKSWTIVARTFGIGSNLNEPQAKAYQDVEKNEPAPAAPEKNFGY